jgi:menaquinone-dependent protoporphyrinogen oxidase
MHVLVAYASRHGATQGIAERIALVLEAGGVTAEALPAASVRSVAAYDAFVVGSAAYMFHWEKAAVAFVRRNRAVLAAKPVWLFSSGPLGSEAVDAQGRDQRLAAIPKEDAREHRVFFGAYERDRKPIGIAERFVSIMPAAKEAMPEGDFRDWPEIEAWAAGIAAALLQAPAG